MDKKSFVDELSVRAASEFIGQQVQPPKKEKKRKPYTVTDKATRAQHLREYSWKPGQSGNPKGRPPNPLSLTALLNAKLTAHPELANAIVDALINMGGGRDMRAIEMAFERIDGKVAETHRIEAEIPVRLVFRPAQEILGLEKENVIEGESREVPQIEEGK